MRILFVDNLLFEGSADDPAFDLQPHLGLLSLVAVARNSGHEAAVIDPKLALVDGDLSWSRKLYEDIARLILRQGPDLVGFTALGCNFHCVVQIASEIHRLRPDLKILLGGPHATILDKEILEAFPMFAAIARHEAEETLVPTIEAIESGNLADVPGLSWRRPDGTVVQNPGTPKIADLDDLPHAAFDAYPIEALALRSLRIEAGRGCPFSCTFCSTASFFGRSYRLKSADRIVAELDALNRRYGIGHFKLNHDLFTVSKRKVLAFCERASGRGYEWSCSARVDCVDDELLRAMAVAGCRSIYFGIETGSSSMQARSCKRLDLALVEPTLNLAQALGIRTTTSFIIGYPDESLDDRALTIDMVGRLHLRSTNTSQMHVLTPEPGTTLLATHGAALRFDRRRCGFNLPHFSPSDEALIAAHPNLFVTHYHFLTCVDHALNVASAAIWQQIATVGAPIFRHLLDHWQGRLSSLLDEAATWWRDRAEGEEAPDAGALVRFAITVFGPDAPVVSALRHRLAARSGPAGLTSLLSRRPTPRAPTSRLADGITVLRKIHDVSAAEFALSSGRQAELTNLVVRRSNGTDPAMTFEVDEMTADVLAAALVDEGILSHLAAADLARLQTLGILH